MKVRITLYSVFFLLLYTVQYVFTPLHLNGVSPEYLLCAVVALGLFENQTFGAIYGIVFGLFADFGGGGVFGTRAVLFMIIGYCVGYFAENRISSNLISCLAISLGTVFLTDTLYAILQRILFSAPFFETILRITLPKIFLTALMCCIIYFVIKFIGTNRKWRRYNEKIR